MAGYNNDFLEWYKKNYNSDYDSNKGYARGENITDEDWEVGNNLYQAYIRKNDLSNQFNRTKESLEKEKSKSQQAASVQLDKLQKYLPTQIRAQGLGGLGVSESTLLQAQNNYQNTLGEIDSDIGGRQMELLNNYQSGVNALEEEKAATNQSIFDKYTTIKREDEAKKQALELEAQQTKQNNLYTEFMAKIDGGEFNTVKELRDSFNALKDSLREDQKTILDERIKFYENNPSQIEQDKAYEDEIASKTITDYYKFNTLENGNKIKVLHASKPSGTAAWHDDHADNFTIKVGDTQVGIEMGDKVASGEQQAVKEHLKAALGRSPKEGDACLYNGQLVVVCTNGTLRFAKDRSKFWAWNWGKGSVNDIIERYNYD